MKRLLAGFTLMAVALAFTVGTPGCTKKEPTSDNLDKNKKPNTSDVMVKPEPKPKASGEASTLPPDTPKKKVEPTPLPPPIPLTPPDEPKKKTSPLPPKLDLPPDAPKKKTTTDPLPPKLDLPPDEPKKKGASLEQIRPTRDALLRAALEQRLGSS